MENNMTNREMIVEIVNKLFIYTDSQQWNMLQTEVFDATVFLDMSSMGGEAKNLTSKQICDMWEEGFKDLDAVNHLGGNYLVNFTTSSEAAVFAYATATHYKAEARKGNTRDFVGTYDLKLRSLPEGWRIVSFVYNLKYAIGNLELK